MAEPVSVTTEIEGRLKALTSQRDAADRERADLEEQARVLVKQSESIDARLKAWTDAWEVLKRAEDNLQPKVTITGHIDTDIRKARPFRGR